MSDYSSYSNYYRDHFRSGFSDRDIAMYLRWFGAQWRCIQDRMGALDHKRVLEVGAGLGAVYELIRPSHPTYVGLELDTAAVAFAQRRHPDANFLPTRIEDFESDEPFDLAFAFEVLEHLPNPSRGIERIRAALTDDGVFCGTTPFPYKKNVLADSTHVSVLHPVNWARLFESAGFAVVELHPMSFVPLLWRVNPRLNVRIPFYVAIPQFVSTCLIVARCSG